MKDLKGKTAVITGAASGFGRELAILCAHEGMNVVLSDRDEAGMRGTVERLPPGDRDSVLLTFDDGPHPEGTPAVLEVLQRYGARAVFFVVGSRVPRAPEMLQRIAAAGHVLGNHSHAHPLGRQFGLRDYRRDIDACQRIWTKL